ncbi:hypothetical protein [Nonomuraea sp. LPB2021202275-12-8]|uniref:hypothetical protein n=1 Tax=Nonomuraea sp. LPB2021202275-12-8 TaxID=3120159 RepID=UPI00300D7B60
MTYTGAQPAPSVLDRIGGGLVVSCQAPEEHPPRDSGVIAGLAERAEPGGAARLPMTAPVSISGPPGTRR